MYSPELCTLLLLDSVFPIFPHIGQGAYGPRVSGRAGNRLRNARRAPSGGPATGPFRGGESSVPAFDTPATELYHE